MFDPLSPIYSELQRLQINEITPSFRETVQIRQFATAVTQNILDLEGRTWGSKLLRILFLIKLASLTILRSIWKNFFLNFFKIKENFKKSTVTAQQILSDNIYH